jgi:hypothetical protein
MRFLQTLTRRIKQSYSWLDLIRIAARLEAMRTIRRQTVEKLGSKEDVAYLTVREKEEIALEQRQFELSLFSAVGKALTAWAQIEDLVVALFSMLIGSSQTKAGVIFYSIINFGTWLSIVTELIAQDELYSPFQARWNKLIGRLRGLKEVRDRVAHHSAIVPDTIVDLVSLTSLKPSIYDTRSKSLNYSPLTTSQIEEFFHRMIDVAKDLESLIDDMKAVGDKKLQEAEEEFQRLYDIERAAGRTGFLKDHLPSAPI